ncbi:hypothetical protein CYMTET_19442 [Cymbomonas tetramitiformis]|uniref:Uncharacterized protein n=1 Tax=Cymbomonas tetramitiformis TaxID=36881 RepID=A0AAE0G616_9CHLO|nr:hypothetical protein CYMTET_19442 [Cymbomonas tetramitiformis]
MATTPYQLIAPARLRAHPAKASKRQLTFDQLVATPTTSSASQSPQEKKFDLEAGAVLDDQPRLEALVKGLQSKWCGRAGKSGIWVLVVVGVVAVPSPMLVAVAVILLLLLLLLVAVVAVLLLTQVVVGVAALLLLMLVSVVAALSRITVITTGGMH